MNTSLPTGLLNQAVKALSLHWNETRASWRDAKATEFEQKYIATLPNEVIRTANAMKELEQVLRSIHASCE